MAQDSPLWQHGKISREKAELLLKPWQDGLWLVRESTHYPGDYTLCVCISGRVEHYHIITTTQNENSRAKVLTIDEEVYFPNLPALIQHYKADADGLVSNLKIPIERVETGKDINQLISGPWAVKKSDLQLGDELGHGFFGAVRIGEYHGSKVAVKVISGNKEAADAIIAEASIMTQLRHKNLVALIGVVPDPPNSISIVLEFMAKGNLLDYVRSRGRSVITKKIQLKFSLDIVSGMKYLEEKLFVHRDLAARNILISEADVAKVSDFGLAQDNSSQLGVGGKIPVKWTAPEAYRHKQFTTMSDVWSFGILLWELFSFGRVPYPRVPADEVMRYLEDGSRMASPGDECKDVHEVMLRCWNQDPQQRPTFARIASMLSQLSAASAVDKIPSS